MRVPNVAEIRVYRRRIAIMRAPVFAWWMVQVLVMMYDTRVRAGTTVDPPHWIPTLESTVTPIKASIGAAIRVTLSIRRQPTVSVSLPLRLELGPFSELSRREIILPKEKGRKSSAARKTSRTPKTRAPRKATPGKEQPAATSRASSGDVELVEEVFQVEVAAYTLGKLELPAITVNALGPDGSLYPLRTGPRKIEIVSVMLNEPQPKLKGLGAPLRVYRQTWWLLYLLGGLALAGLLAGATIFLYRRSLAHKARLNRESPMIPADFHAQGRLAGLDVDDYLKEGRFKALYLELSEILREYLERGFKIEALEMTSDEIRRALTISEVPQSAHQRLCSFFEQCDLVKFAKMRPDDDVARETVIEAQALINVTRPNADEVSPVASAPASTT